MKDKSRLRKYIILMFQNKNVNFAQSLHNMHYITHIRNTKMNHKKSEASKEKVKQKL